MPIYEFHCEICGASQEVIQDVTKDAPLCCSVPMVHSPTVPAMVKWKGEGGFPSRRREFSDRKALMSRKQLPYLSEENKKT